MATATDTVEVARRRAWAEYAELLRGLEGEEYRVAEQDAWERLQQTLDELAVPDSLPDDGIG